MQKVVPLNYEVLHNLSHINLVEMKSTLIYIPQKEKAVNREKSIGYCLETKAIQKTRKCHTQIT